MNNTKSLLTGMKPRDAIKLGIVKLDKSDKHPKENVLLEDGLYRHLDEPEDQHGNLTKTTWID